MPIEDPNAPAEEPSVIGEILGGYRVVEKLDEGGMGAVYLAEHTLLERQAAIKMLLPEVSHKKETVQRFFTEAKAAAAISHPGIVEIFDFGYHTDGSAYLIMEYLEGESLEDRIKRLHRMPIPKALGLGQQICNALAAAHEAKIIHRDLKPENIFIVADPDMPGGERIKLLDFGLAKLVDRPGHKTQTGMVVGTPAYMAPEQCRGAGKVDWRADLYAVGCVLYRLLCGKPPFLGEGAGDIMAAHIRDTPLSPRSLEPAIPGKLEVLILRLLAKSPDNRLQSAVEIAAALREIETGGVGDSGAVIEESTDVLTRPDHVSLRAHPVRAQSPVPVAARPDAALTARQTPPSLPMLSNHTTLRAATGESSTVDFQRPHTPLPLAQPSPRTSRRPVVIGAALVIVAIAALVLVSGEDPEDPAEPLAENPAASSATGVAESIETAASPAGGNEATADARLALPGDDNQQGSETDTHLADLLDQLRGAAASRRHAEVMTLMAQFPPDAPEFQEARAIHDRLRDEFLSSVTERTGEWKKRRACDRIDRLVDQIGNLWPEAIDVAKKNQRACRPIKVTDGKSAKGKKKLEKMTLATLRNKAQQSARKRQFTRALKYCRAGLELAPRDQHLLSICAHSACYLKAPQTARSYYQKLRGSRKSSVRQTCLRNGVDVE